MKNRIKEVMKRVFQQDEIADDISQSNCAKWDSMTHLNLIVELEEEFDMSLEPEDMADMKSLEIIERTISESK